MVEFDSIQYMHEPSSENSQQPKSIKTAIRFTELMIAVILLGLLVRFISSVVQRSYDGQHRFTIAITRKEAHSDILSFSPENQTISLLHVTGGSSSLARDLSIPIDATVYLSHAVAVDDPRAFMTYLAAHMNETKTLGMNTFDATALVWFSQKVHSENTTIQRLSLPLASSVTLTSLFSDQTIYGEGKSVAVINATGESGVGSRMTKLVTNMGGNVISVTAASSDQDASTIQYYGEKNYTVTKLEKVLHFKLVPMVKQTYSDIIITIGIQSNGAQEF